MRVYRPGGYRRAEEANFPGHCDGCDGPISVGERVVRVETGERVHEECVR